MGYYKDTGSLWSMASAEAILKKRMPEKVGILPVAELLFVAESMWVGEHDMKGHFHPSFRFVKAKRYNAKPHVLIELDGETLADINGRSKYYEGFSRCVDRKPLRGSMETDRKAPSRGLAFAVEIPIAPLTANIGAIQMIWSQE